MKCKHCEAELEKDNPVCPSCGEVNEIEKETAAAQKNQEENMILVTPGKFALAVGACVVLLAVLVALVIGGLSSNTGKESLPTTVPSDPSGTVAATVPAGTGLDDVTNKGTYTVTDAEAAASANLVVGTVGDRVLTNGQLQAYYWMYIRQFLTSEMGYYALYIGLDYTQPLDTQLCYFNPELTWQQYFLQEALNSWYSYQALALEAEAAGYEMDLSYQEYLENLPSTLEQSAAAQGFASVDELLCYYVGPGATLDDYMAYETLYYQGNTYFIELCSQLDPTDAEVEAFFVEHEAEYAERGLTRETKTVNVRHILILPEGATIETIYSESFTEEAWQAGQEEAEGILNTWENGSRSEDSFAALANQYSVDPGSNTNGGLYTDVYQGEMVASFDEWCFDPARQVGDTAIVRTEIGWHIMYYSGETILWPGTARNDLISFMEDDMMAKIMEEYPVDVDYTQIVLGNVPLA